MRDPTGRWLNAAQWQCPKCGWVNGAADASCQKCARSVRPPEDEPVRPPDPLDLIGRGDTTVANAGLVERATTAVHTLTKVARENAMARIGDSLRTGLKRRGQHGDRAWRAITDLPEEDQRAALGDLVDDLEAGGFALYRIDTGELG
jgi:hypothetical protein